MARVGGEKEKGKVEGDPAFEQIWSMKMVYFCVRAIESQPSSAPAQRFRNISPAPNASSIESFAPGNITG